MGCVPRYMKVTNLNLVLEAWHSLNGFKVQLETGSFEQQTKFYVVHVPDLGGIPFLRPVNIVSNNRNDRSQTRTRTRVSMGKWINYRNNRSQTRTRTRYQREREFIIFHYYTSTAVTARCCVEDVLFWTVNQLLQFVVGYKFQYIDWLPKIAYPSVWDCPRLPIRH